MKEHEYLNLSSHFIYWVEDGTVFMRPAFNAILKKSISSFAVGSYLDYISTRPDHWKKVSHVAPKKKKYVHGM